MRELRQRFHKRIVQQAIAEDDLLTIDELHGRSVDMRGFAARFFDKERYSRDVPRVTHGHHEAIDAPTRRKAALDYRRTQAFHTFERFGFASEIARVLRIDFRSLAHVKITIRDNRMRWVRFWAYMNLFVIHKSTHAFRSCVKFAEFG